MNYSNDLEFFILGFKTLLNEFPEDSTCIASLEFPGSFPGSSYLVFYQEAKLTPS